MDPKGKTALITGGAIRIGKAITLGLARAGANVVINYHGSAAEAEETAGEARALGVEALTLQADVADNGQVTRMAALAHERFGAVDILVNSASLFKRTPLPAADVSAWQRVTRISIDGAFFCANALAPKMIEKGEGAIVNIVDLSAWDPWAGFAAHSVGKAALLALTRQLALELAPAVRVNAVAPGPVLPPPGYDAARIEGLAQKTLLKRWGTPEDVAQAVVFLVQASYITADCIIVDGGQSVGARRL
jgi:NAD(P)-dependent dehydrogenase (short-subunit alcohol dehydrogenase family)